MTGASASCFGERYRDVLSSQNLDENNSTQTSTDCCCTVVCKQSVQLQHGCRVSVCVCVCYIQFARYTSVYVVPGECNSYLESNSVLLIVTNDDTTSAVLPTRRGAHEKSYGIRNRRRNVYASLEVWMLWLGCLGITAVHGACV